MTRVALITGGAQGLGAAAAKRFLQDGFAGAVLVDRDADGLARQKKVLSDIGKIEVLAADLREDATPSTAVDLAIKTFGRLDVLLNAAGDTSRWGVEDTTYAAYHQMFDVNVKAPLFMMQKASDAIIRSGQGGVIINIASMLAHGGPPNIGIYAGSKAALVALSKNAANALKHKGVRVFCVNLGWTHTDGEHKLQTQFHKQPEDWAERMAPKLPFGRLITPDDVAGLCAFLVSPPAQMMTGAVIDYEQMPIGTYDFHPMVPPV